VIDGSSDSVVATVNVGEYPAGIAIDPSTDLIYVTDSSGTYGTVSVIDGSSNSVVATLNVGGSGIAIDPSTDLIYVINSGPVGTMPVIDGSSNSVVATVDLARYDAGIAVDPNTNLIYIALSSVALTVINGSNNSVVANLNNVGIVNEAEDPAGIAVDPSTNFIYLVNFESNTVSVINNGSFTFVTAPTTTGFDHASGNPGTLVRMTAANATDLNTTYLLSFEREIGLVPMPPTAYFVLACINQWKYPSTDGTGLDINAWKFPLEVLPVITGVSKIGADQTQTFTIQGQGFGSLDPYNGNSPFIRVIDETAGWQAVSGGDGVHFNITRSSGMEVPNDKYRCWHEGYEAHKFEMANLLITIDCLAQRLDDEVRNVKELKIELEKQKAKFQETN